MTSLLSLSFRRRSSQNYNSSDTINEGVIHNSSSALARQQQHQNHQQLRRRSQVTGVGINSFVTAQQSPSVIDPWGLGIATSTSSSCDSVGGFGGQRQLQNLNCEKCDEVRLPVTPATPEGLRPRKSIHRIRQEVHNLMIMHSSKRVAIDSCDEVVDAGKPIGCGMTPHSTSMRSTVSPSPPPHSTSPSSVSLQQSEYMKMSGKFGVDVPSSFTCVNNSTPSTLAMESLKHSTLFNNAGIAHGQQQHEEDDEDIISNPSKISQEPQHMALSPDLDNGRTRTAVGAVVFAMTASSANAASNFAKSVSTNQRTSNHSILPDRDWMDQNCEQDDADNVMPNEEDDDNESSLHASPSSNPWRRRQMQFNEDTSFTRDLNSSWIRDGAGRDGFSYDFNPIFVEPGANNRMNISAISHSLHQNTDVDSSIASMADTMNDDEDCQDCDKVGEIPRFYQALIEEDNIVQNEDTPDHALILAKKQNQRRTKENLILSTLERLQDDLSLLNEIQGHDETPIDFEFYDFIRLNHDQLYHRIDDILLGIKLVGCGARGFHDDTTAQALQFYLSLLQVFKESKHFPDGDATFRWRPVHGFRTSIGFNDEDPLSPTSANRDCTASLRSFSSNNANDATPHTSNVSIATTITTVLSPEHSSRFRMKDRMLDDHSQHSDNVAGTPTRQVVEIISRILKKLRNASYQIVENCGDKAPALQEVRSAYLDLLQLPINELNYIVKSFELVPSEQVSSSNATTTSATSAQSESLSRKKKIDSKVASEHTTDARTSTVSVTFENDDNVLPESNEIDGDGVLRISVIQNEHDNCEVEVRDTDQFDELETEHDRFPQQNWNGNGFGYEPLIDDQTEGAVETHVGGPFDDLRRLVGSFDLECTTEERDQAPSVDEDNERVADRSQRINSSDHLMGAVPTIRSPRRRLEAARRWRRRIFARRGGGGVGGFRVQANKHDCE